jgi:hypothetical protein
MGRPVYQYELADPDFCWLISNFQENYPSYRLVEMSSLPVVFVRSSECSAAVHPAEGHCPPMTEEPLEEMKPNK